MENVLLLKEQNKFKRKIYSYYFALLIIVIMFVAIVWTMMKLKTDPDSAQFANCAICLVGLVFSAILFLSCIIGNFSLKVRKNLYFVLMLMGVSLEFFCVASGSPMQGIPKFNTHIFVFANMYYFLSALYCFLLMLYMIEFFPNKGKYKNFIRFFIILLILYAIVIVINMFTGILFKVENGVITLNKNDMITLGFNVVWILMFFFIIITAKIKPRLKRAFLSYVMFNVVITLANALLTFVLKVEALVNFEATVHLLPLYIIFVSLYLEDRYELQKQKADNIEMKTAIMISQIQPHFVYNALATISGLCREEGAMKSREVVNKFADYLRTNIDSLEFHQLVPFEKELEHIKTYLWIEKMRFGDDLNVEYDIEFSDFELPTLTIQPLVENAVKHGICKKENGGTVKIVTRKDKDCITIQVIDDGVGFDVNQKLDDGRAHVGIKNILSRLNMMNKGTLEIKSEVGKGTSATLKIFYKVVGGGYC